MRTCIWTRETVKSFWSVHFDDWLLILTHRAVLLTISFLPCSPWERAPLEPFTPALCQLLFGCGTLFGIHTHLKWTRQGQFLSTPGVFSVLWEEVGGSFGSATSSSQRECLANHRSLGKEMAAQPCLWMFWLLRTYNMAWKSLEGAVWGGAKGIVGFYSSFSSCLSSLSLSVLSWQSRFVSWIADWKRKSDFI